ncbi:mesenteric estrogen-dependent adipogenesis protein-like isoform X2 [Mugil cephalus]|uniref:mesenteric estrogen-dependent adipogenesis protein-like isoform X2 n=1 Tax=Mugil cephalus TaxID=48193 RepID=UPI001FB700BC|nr:mesenteric estrogen-dependent adipogenesis protein-like isoform X2 [Mugil cephalus]
MTINKLPHSGMTVTEVGEFLRNPPAGFSVETLGSCYRVHNNNNNNKEESLVLIDDLESCGGTVVFQKSLGRKVKMHNLWEYTSMRKSLLSKRIYLLVSACRENFSTANKSGAGVLEQYVVSIDGNNPFIKWQMERGLDWTISSVAGESYRVEIDLTEALESWAAKNVTTDAPMEAKPVWRDASFTLKYYSDALFDFPHWFGFSKRKFKLRLT